MVDQPVHDGHNHVVVGEELAPGGEVLVGGDDHRAVALASSELTVLSVYTPLLTTRAVHTATTAPAWI